VYNHNDIHFLFLGFHPSVRQVYDGN